MTKGLSQELKDIIRMALEDGESMKTFADSIAEARGRATIATGNMASSFMKETPDERHVRIMRARIRHIRMLRSQKDGWISLKDASVRVSHMYTTFSTPKPLVIAETV